MEALAKRIMNISLIAALRVLAAKLLRASRLPGPLASDVRFALRLAGRSPGFLLLTTLSLALAIGVNTAVFSVAEQFLYQRLGVPHPEQLRLLGWRGGTSTVAFSYGTNFDARDAGMTCDRFSWAVFRQLRNQDRSMAGIFAFWERSGAASIAGNSQRVGVEMFSDNYYRVLGVRPQLGRPIASGVDSGDEAVALISDGLWEREFGRSPSVLGQTVTINHIPLTIIGVNPRGFTGAGSTLRSPELFVPLSMQPRVFPWSPESPSVLSDPGAWMLDVMGRIKPGESAQEARAALNVELAGAVRGSLKVRPYETVPQIVLADGARGLHLSDQTFKKPVNALLVLVLLVLVLACANIANLMLARGLRRGREIAVRVALGASRGRIVRQLLTESLVLAAIGGCGGLLLGYFGRNLLPRLLTSTGPQHALDVRFTWGVWLFSAVVTILTGVAFGLVPALSAVFSEARGGLQQAAVNASRSGVRGGKFLVVLQIALSALLVMGAVLFVRTVADLGSTNLGFRTDHLFLAAIATPRKGYPGTKSVLLHQRLEQAIANTPGVEAVTANEMTWLAGDRATVSFYTKYDIAHPGRSEDERINVVDNGFFRVMGIPIIAGRGFDPTDNAAAPQVAIINEALAKSRFSGQNPVGERFALSGHPKAKDWIEVVGVARDTKYQDLRETPPPQFFLPSLQQQSIVQMTYAIRSHLDEQALLAELRRAVATVDPKLSIAPFQTVRQQIDENTRPERTLAAITSGFGVLALTLAVIGIYGVMLCLVEQRRKEIGVRLALGAQRTDVRNIVLRESAGLALAGTAVGLAASQAFTRVVRSILYGVSPHNLLTLSVVAALLVLVALGAAWIPARQALP